MAVKKLDPNTPVPEKPVLLDQNATPNGVNLLPQSNKDTSTNYDTKSKVKEIVFPQDGWPETTMDETPYTEPRTVDVTPTPTTTPWTEWNPIVDDVSVEDASIAVSNPWSPKKVGWWTASSNNQWRQLKNADVNFSQYWDDSSAPNQATAWGQNDKYEWEGVKTSNVNYNPNATIEWLNPDYQYGMDAQWANTASAGYIARRNDEIASALYNDAIKQWRNPTKDDVINFLSRQKWWTNSTEADRVNTVESVWKRLGQIVSENPQSDTPAPEWDNLWGNVNNEAISNMEADLLKSWAWELFGKVGVDENGRVQTLEDANSVLTDVKEKRIQDVKNLQIMDSNSIASAVISGVIASDSQQMRDLQQYDPAKYQEVQTAIKQIRGQMTINDITAGSTDYISNEINSKNASIETEKNTLAESMWGTDEEIWALLSDIDTTLSNNATATSAEATMANITADINKLNTRLKNLKSEAQSLFKWDVPQYIVNAYIANRTAEIQSKLQELQYNYDAAYSRYQTELNNSWKEKEYQLKLDQLQMNKELQNFNMWYKKQEMAASNIITDKNWVNWKLNINPDGSVYFSQVQQVTQYAWSGMAWAWLKNNNPGNIKDTQFWNVIGTWANGFAQFATPEDWFDALVEKVKFNQNNPSSRYYGKTIAEYFQIYAPSSDGNDPKGYAQDVANKLWVSVNTPISQLDPIKFAAAIAKHDSGYDYSTYWEFRDGWAKSKSVDLSSIEVPDSIYDVEVWSGMDWKPLIRRVDPNSEEGKKLKESYINEMWYSQWGELIATDWDTSSVAYKVISDDGETPIDFRQRIYNLVPATLKNSDTELKNLYRIAKDLYKAWYSADEAAMIFYWLDPRDDKTWLVKPLIYTARTAWRKLDETFYWSLWSLLETWNIKQAIRLVENSVLSEDEKLQEQKAVSIVSKIQRLEWLLKDAEDEVWPIDKKLNKLITDWYWDEKYAALAADIDNIYWEIRNELMWSAVTEKEKELYTGMFPSMSDKVSTIKQKLRSTKNSKIQDINAVRKMYDLPTLNQYTLVDYWLRASLYNQEDANI